MWTVSATVVVVVVLLGCWWTCQVWSTYQSPAATTEDGEAHEFSEALDLSHRLHATSSRILATAAAAAFFVAALLTTAPTPAQIAGYAVVTLLGAVSLVTAGLARFLHPEPRPLPNTVIGTCWAVAAAATTLFVGIPQALDEIAADATTGADMPAYASGSLGWIIGQGVAYGWWAGAVVGVVAVWHLRRRSVVTLMERREADRARQARIRAYAAHLAQQDRPSQEDRHG